MWGSSYVNINSRNQKINFESSLYPFLKIRSKTGKCPPVFNGPPRVPVHHGVQSYILSLVFYRTSVTFSEALRTRERGHRPPPPRPPPPALPPPSPSPPPSPPPPDITAHSFELTAWVVVVPGECTLFPSNRSIVVSGLGPGVAVSANLLVFGFSPPPQPVRSPTNPADVERIPSLARHARADILGTRVEAPYRTG